MSVHLKHETPKFHNLIGLTGNIGSGKSTVADIFRKEGIPVISSDEIVHTLYGQDQELQDFLVQEFGSTDKKIIARQIFGKEENKQKRRILLESKIHPKVEMYLHNWVQLHEDKPILVNDVPLLFEAKLEDRFQKIIVVGIKKDLQIARIQARNPEMSLEEIENRIDSQMSQEEKIARADYVIHNNSGLLNLAEEVKIIVKRIRKLSKNQKKY